MLALIWALVAAPPVQDAATEAPTSARSGDLTVSRGSMMGWSVNGGLGGQVTVLVDNAGAGTDRIVSMTTPAGTIGDVGVYRSPSPSSGPGKSLFRPCRLHPPHRHSRVRRRDPAGR